MTLPGVTPALARPICAARLKGQKLFRGMRRTCKAARGPTPRAAKIMQQLYKSDLTL